MAKAHALTASAPMPVPATVEVAAPSTLNRSNLNLADALALAARHNRSIAAADASLDMAGDRVGVARSALLPTNSVRGAYNWYSDEQTNSIDLDPALLPPNTPAPVVTVRQRDFATISAAVRLAIDLSGELRHGLSAAQAGFRAERARAWGTRLEEEASVTSAYFRLLEAKRLREVMAQTIALHERQLADASRRYEQGRLTRNEVLVVDVALASSRQRLLQLDNAIATSRRSLNRATGLEVRAPTEVVDVAGRPDMPSVEDALATAQKDNPLVAAMVEEAQASDERITSAKRSRFGRVGVGVGYEATSATILTPNNYATAGVTVEVDLGSFEREARIAELQAASRRTRLLLDRTAREIDSLVLDSHDRLRERLAAIDAQTVAVGQAEENLRIRQVQFDEGRATSEDLLDAAELATRQKAALASSLYQAHTGRAELQALMGRPLSELADAAPAPSAAPSPTLATGEAQP